MRIFASILMVLCAGASALARPVPSTPKHPAVVRVVVPEGDGMSLGSGALVSVSDDYGLVVTNWHVVRDGHGTATVIFPDGFRSTATVVRTDRDWDLAALLIWRPRVRPIPLAGNRPKIGEPLWIAGYGRGSYRMAQGECTHYLSPGGRLPFDMIELSAGARQGDSGGPILNQQGELAGVLFGAAWGKTSGSHCLRVREFLNPVLCRLDTLPRGAGTMLAQRGDAPQATAPGRGLVVSDTPTATIPAGPNAARPPAEVGGERWGVGLGSPSGTPPTSHGRGESAGLDPRGTPWSPSSPAGAAFAAPLLPTPSGASAVPPGQPISSDAWEQAKTLLAIVGLLAICFHTLRWLGK